MNRGKEIPRFHKKGTLEQEAQHTNQQKKKQQLSSKFSTQSQVLHPVTISSPATGSRWRTDLGSAVGEPEGSPAGTQQTRLPLQARIWEINRACCPEPSLEMLIKHQLERPSNIDCLHRGGALEGNRGPGTGPYNHLHFCPAQKTKS